MGAHIVDTEAYKGSPLPTRYSGDMQLEFDGEVFRWSAREQDWFFVALPPDLSAEIREIPRPQRGFGSVRVLAQIGVTQWRTSIFPDASRGAYILPLKRAVRDAERIDDEALVTVTVDVLDA